MSEKCNRCCSDISGLNVSISDHSFNSFSLRNPTVVLMIFKLKFRGNLTIFVIHFSLRKPTVVQGDTVGHGGEEG